MAAVVVSGAHCPNSLPPPSGLVAIIRGQAVRHPREVDMPKIENERITETATEARQAEPGPSVLMLLVVSVGLAALILAVVWFVFFRT